MNLQSAPTKQIVEEFRRRVALKAPHPEQPLEALCQRNLGDLRSYGKGILDSLDTACEAYEREPSNNLRAIALEAALAAVHRFGLGWSNELIRERAYESIRVCEKVCQDAGPDAPLRPAGLAIAQLSLKADIDQVFEAVNTPKILSEDFSPEQLMRELDLAIPRHVLVESNYLPEIMDAAAGSISVGVASSAMLRDQLSGDFGGTLLSYPALRFLAQDTVNVLVLLIPALHSSLHEVDCQVSMPAAELVDALSWVAEAAVLRREVPPTQSAANMQAEALLSIKDLAWIALSVLLDPAAPWAEDVKDGRGRLTNVARTILQDDQRLHRSHSKRIGLTFFLGVVDQSEQASVYREASIKKLVRTLADLAPSSLKHPTEGEALAAAIAWWLRPPQEATLAKLNPPSSPAIVKQAFWGHITHPLTQSFLYRALQEQL